MNELHAHAGGGLTLYAVLLDSGQAWDGSAFVSIDGDDWGLYALGMAEAAAGIYLATMPAVAAGVYSYVVYERAGGSPAVTDRIRGSGWLAWDGSAEIVPLVPQEIADALKLAPAAGTPAAGSVLAELAAILEDTSTTLPALLTSTLASFVNTYSTDATTAGSITRRRGDSWAIVPAALGVLTGYTSLWLTIKRSHDDVDSASVLHVKKNASGLLDGLLYLNGAASTSNLASITVTDALTGVISIAVDEAATKELAPGEYCYDVQTLIAGDVATPDSGTFTVTADVTRSVT